MTWNPQSTKRLERVNIAGTIESRSKTSEEAAGILTKFRSSDGKGWGEIDFPEVAPLIFPALDTYGARTDAAAATEKPSLPRVLVLLRITGIKGLLLNTLLKHLTVFWLKFRNKSLNLATQIQSLMQHRAL